MGVYRSICVVRGVPGTGGIVKSGFLAGQINEQ